jgi:hypothetical protein
VQLIKGDRSWIELKLRVNHPDVDRRPVDVAVWCDGVRVISERITSNAPAVVYVNQPLTRPAMVVDTAVSRVVRPAASGSGDPRILGAQLAWRAVDAPPPNARIVRLR